MTQTRRVTRAGLSLLELLAVVTILGTIATIVVPRLGDGAKVSQSSCCNVNARLIEVQASLWRREKGGWPSSTLANIGADPDFFPDGLPTCPLDASSYQIDTSTGRIIGHNH
ncbi:MAG: type II secretion system protein [Pirellulaceae bacterium]